MMQIPASYSHAGNEVVRPLKRNFEFLSALQRRQVPASSILFVKWFLLRPTLASTSEASKMKLYKFYYYYNYYYIAKIIVPSILRRPEFPGQRSCCVEQSVGCATFTGHDKLETFLFRTVY